METGRPQRGLDLLQRAHPGPKASRLPDLQFNTALAHNALGQSREAAACFLQAAQLYRSQGDGGSEGDACVEMSRCYSRTQVTRGGARIRSWAGTGLSAGSVCYRTGLWRLRVSCGLQRVTEWQPCWVVQPMH